MWAFLGGLFVVLLLARVAPPDRRHPIGAVTAFRHAAVMAVAMGVSVFLVLHFEVPHGYWVPMTMALVLQPFGVETTTRARQRIAGTIGGGLLALGLALVLPTGVVAVAVLPLMVLGVAYSILGRYSKSVMFLTPSAVLLANLASRDAEISATLHRLVATLVGGIVAAVLALLLEHADTEQPSPADSEPSPVELGLAGRRDASYDWLVRLGVQTSGAVPVWPSVALCCADQRMWPRHHPSSRSRPICDLVEDRSPHLDDSSRTPRDGSGT